jgi:hypothetical protein
MEVFTTQINSNESIRKVKYDFGTKLFVKVIMILMYVNSKGIIMCVRILLLTYMLTSLKNFRVMLIPT